MLVVGWGGLLDGYFRLAVETSVEIESGQVETKRVGWEMRFTFKVMASSSVRWRRWPEDFGSTTFSSDRCLKSLPRVAA